MDKFRVNSRSRNELIDITHHVQEVVKSSSVHEGLAVVFVPHTTAAVTINENADPTVKGDLLNGFTSIAPANLPAYRHAEGNSDAHIKASLVGSSETIIITDGHLVLGTWQGIYFCEFDGPRSRQVMVQIIPA